MTQKLFFIILSSMIILAGCGNSMNLLFEERGDLAAVTSDKIDEVESPIFNYASGVYSHDLSIEITIPTRGAEVFYTTDDAIPDKNSQPYTSALSLIGDENTIKIRARTYFNGIYSDESIVNYKVDYGQVSTPQFKVIGMPFDHELGGFYQHDIQIEIISTTPGANIYYTIDGTVPDTNSSTFSFPIYINGLTGTLTISAFATKTDMDDSNTEIATFTVEYLTTEPPIFDPPGGEYTGAQLVNLHSETEGATIVYTTDGSDPMTSSTMKFGNSVLVDESMLLRAYAMKPGMWSSPEAQANYIINE